MSGAKGRLGCCSARTVLWYLTLAGFAVNYMIRINLNIAIVSMVEPRSTPINQSTVSECYTSPPTNTSFPDLANTTTRVIMLETSGKDPKYLPETNFKRHTFKWNEKEQSRILGAFFWLHWLMQIPGGILGAKYGSKLVFGLSNFAGVLCIFFIPSAAFMGKNYLIMLRMFQGLVCGFAWPSMQTMTARWIPPNERSKFMSAFLGSSLGVAVTYPVCGLILHYLEWEWVFYISGSAGTLWFICWWLLVYDSPGQHPRIEDDEKDYILESLGNTSSTKNIAPVPWKSIFTSVHVWMNIFAQFGGIWGLFTLMTHAPTYFRFIHGMSIQTTGFMSGQGHLLRAGWSLFCGQIADYLIRSNKMSRTNVRKVATACCTIGQGFFMLLLAFTACNYWPAVICLSLAVAMNGSVSAGPLAAMVDISPNYAGIILGIVNSVVAIVGFITPAVVGHLTYQNQTVGQWQKVFLISSAMGFGSGILYSIFAKADVQPWNAPEMDKKETELMPIKRDVKDVQEDEYNKNGYAKVAVTRVK